MVLRSSNLFFRSEWTFIEDRTNYCLGDHLWREQPAPRVPLWQLGPEERFRRHFLHGQGIYVDSPLHGQGIQGSDSLRTDSVEDLFFKDKA